MEPIRIQMTRLEAIAAWAELAQAAVGDRQKLGQLLNAQVPEAWPPEIMADVMEFFAQRLQTEPEIIGWWVWYLVLNSGKGDRVLIGSAGFNDPPDESGCLLMGYAILPDYQGQGYATEAVGGLLTWAFQQSQVRMVVAETLVDHTASIRVMEKNGMTYLGEGSEEGIVKYGIAT